MDTEYNRQAGLEVAEQQNSHYLSPEQTQQYYSSPNSQYSQPASWGGSPKPEGGAYTDYSASQRASYVSPYPYNPSEPKNGKSSRRICGLRPTLFWILFVLVFLIIAGAVGGGVGGALASQSNNNNSAAAQTSSASTKTASPTSSTSSALPSASPPPDCKESYNGKFQAEIINATTKAASGLEYCGGVAPCNFKLEGGALTTPNGSATYYVGCNWLFSYNSNPSSQCVYSGTTSPWSVCSNGSIAFHNSAVWYDCDNLFYWRPIMSNCYPLYLTVAT